MNDLYNAALLALAWLAAVNAVLSLGAWVAAASGGTRAASAAWLLALRLTPAAGSLIFVWLVFATWHWRLVPRGTDESFGVVVHLLAGVGAWLLARAAWRMTGALQAARHLRRCTALPRIEAGPDTDVFEVAGLTGVALAGVLRPRIFVGVSVRQVLTPGELEAAVAHERAHGLFHDNWKRLAIACAPDLFGHTAAARQLERQWSAMAECRADARAVAGDSTRAANLASALVKVARLGVTPPPTAAWSTLHDEPLIAERIQRLLAGDAPAAPRPPRALIAATWAGGLSGVAAAGALLAGELHALTERVGHMLP